MGHFTLRNCQLNSASVKNGSLFYMVSTDFVRTGIEPTQHLLETVCKTT